MKRETAKSYQGPLLIMAATMTLSLAACGSKDSSDGSGDGSGASGQTTISLYTTIPGKDAEFEALCEEFMEANPTSRLTTLPTTAVRSRSG